MTEEKWHAAANPLHLLMHVRRTAPGVRTAAGKRKFLLFAAVCIDRLSTLSAHEPFWNAVGVFGRFADGRATPAELRRAWEDHTESSDWERLPGTVTSVYHCVKEGRAWEAARVWQWTTQPQLVGLRGTTPAAEKRHLASVVREVFGNPFRPVAFAPAWRTDTAVQLARGMYEARDFGAMPILADALQDAGCDAEDVLTHCRVDGAAHVRGCWVVDLVLGKA